MPQPPARRPPPPPGKVRALVLTGFGINCEEEVAAAYRLAGAEATVAHLNQVLHGQVRLHDFDVLTFPGGFSFGDDLGSGVVLANKLRYRQTGADGRTLLDDLREYIAAGKFVLGICNGFQVLVKLGLLPNLGGRTAPEVTLTHNASGRYEDRWVTLRVNPRANTPFLKGIDTLEVPVRHGEGRLVVPDDATRAALEAAGLNCLSYVDAAGDSTADYPFNPNGAALNCAGLTDPTGQVFGLMPHPEAFLTAYNHPDWARRRRLNPGASEEGAGLRIFRNIVAHISQQPTPEPTSIPDDVFTAPARQWDRVKVSARAMRRAPTPAEDVLWQALRNQQLGVKFRRQHAIDSFIVDFVSLPDKLVVEVAGEIHNEPNQAQYDAGRTDILMELGYHVLRFANEQVLAHLPAVLAIINSHLQAANLQAAK